MKATSIVPAVLAAGLAAAVAAPTGPARGADPGAAGVPELFLPESWAGQWAFAIEYRTLPDLNLTARDIANVTLCPLDRIGLSSYIGDPSAGIASPIETACSGSVDDGRLALTCSAVVTRGACRARFALDVGLDRQHRQISGGGQWRLTEATGDCAALLEDAPPGESIFVSAARTGDDLAACAAPPASLVEKLPGHPEVVRHSLAPIADLSARTDGPTVRLTWGAVPRAAEYEVFRAPEGGAYQRIGLVRGRQRPGFRDPHPFAGAASHYVVRWIAADGRISGMSNEAIAQPAWGREQ